MHWLLEHWEYGNYVLYGEIGIYVRTRLDLFGYTLTSGILYRNGATFSVKCLIFASYSCW